ncbi:3-oxoadipyl-CoA thiolase, partial [Xanthomonas oryzae pv. oryzae]
MSDVYLIDGIRTPIGRYGGALSSVRADDLGAVPIAALLVRHPQMEPAAIDDVYLGCANQAGEDNRNVARMSLLLAGVPSSVPGSTLNRLCGSGLDAVGTVARGIRAGELDLAIAGGVESMSRAPWVMGKADSAFARNQQLEDTTMGWRFINPRLQAAYGTELMGETAENLAQLHAIAREDQDAFALRSQQRVAAAQAAGFFDGEITSVAVAGRKGGDASTVEYDEAPRPNTTAEMLAK